MIEVINQLCYHLGVPHCRFVLVNKKGSPYGKKKTYFRYMSLMKLRWIIEVHWIFRVPEMGSGIVRVTDMAQNTQATSQVEPSIYRMSKPIIDITSDITDKWPQKSTQVDYQIVYILHYVGLAWNFAHWVMDGAQLWFLDVFDTAMGLFPRPRGKSPRNLVGQGWLVMINEWSIYG